MDYTAARLGMDFSETGSGISLRFVDIVHVDASVFLGTQWRQMSKRHRDEWDGSHITEEIQVLPEDGI